MKKTVFLAGRPSQLLEKLAYLYGEQGWNVAVTSEDGTETERDDEPDDILRLSLNRRSPLSNRSCIIDTLSAFTAIDEAIIVHTSEGENRPIHEIPAAGVEAPIDNSIKGVFFLLKELLGHFLKRQQGRLTMAIHTYGPEVLTPIDAAAHGSFRAVTNALFTYYKNEPIYISGFESQSSGIDEYAAYIKETVEEKGPKASGKWYRHSERGGFLSNISLPGFKK